MYRIRKEQLKAFRPVAEAEFARSLMDHLRRHHKQVTVRLPKSLTLVGRMPETSLRQLVQTGIARARSHGFTFTSSISAFVVLMFKAAPNFDQHPTIRQALAEPLSEEHKLRRMIDGANTNIWKEAKAQYDPSAWTHAEGMR